MATTFSDAVTFRDSVNMAGAGTVQHKAGSVESDHIATGANIAASKLTTRLHQTLNQDDGSAATAQTRAVYQARASATLQEVYATVLTAATGDSTVTIDVQKNGTSVLDSTFQVDSADAAYAKVSGTLTTTTVSDDEVIEVVVTVSAGTGTLPQGLMVTVVVDEEGT